MQPRYYHLFTQESSYATAVIELFAEITRPEEHVFIFGLGSARNRSAHYPEAFQGQMRYLRKPRDLFWFFKNIFSARWIYLHFLAYDPTLFFWGSFRRLLRRSSWIVWGSDIYSYYKKDNNLKTRLYEQQRRRIIARLPEIAAFVEEDYELIRSLYTTGARYIPILYPLPVNAPLLDRHAGTPGEGPLTLLLGNSGDPTNHHIEMLEMLSHLSGENIRLICPLSYGGSTAYRRSVTEKGRALFGEKFEALTRYLTPEAYAALLGSVDVALMNHRRQQGLGNILALLYLERKVYLRSDISSWHFMRRQGLQVFDIADIQNLTFGKLKAAPQHAAQNRRRTGELLSEEYIRNIWLRLLERH